MGMNLMGKTNTHWGVCGFTSCFYAMYALSPAKRPQLNNAGTATRVLAEIQSYLMMLKADGERQLLTDIEKFTKFFEGFNDFTVDKYIALINKAVTRSENEIIADDKYSLALPPAAVADYLHRMWEVDAKVSVVQGGDGGVGNGIIGVTSHRRGMVLYDGLEHYMYRHNDKIYSWGEEFSSISEASNQGAGGVQWTVCRVITLQ